MGVGNMGQLRADTSGVSQVVGAVLIIAITVTLAGIAGGFVFTFNDQVEDSSPSFATETAVDQSEETLTIEHVSGATVDVEELTIRVHDARTESGAEVTYAGNVLSSQLSGEFAAGTSIQLDERHFERGGSSLSEALDLGDATVLIVWQEPDSGATRSDTLYSCDVEFPDCSKSSN